MTSNSVDQHPNPESLLEQIETDLDLYDHQRFNLFHEAGQLFALSGNEDLAAKMECEALLFLIPTRNTWSRQDKDRERFQEKGFKAMPGSCLDYFEQRTTQTKNPVLLARYCDYLWEKRRDHNIARKAISAYLDSGYIRLRQMHPEEPRWGIELANFLGRALELAETINDKHEVGRAISSIISAMEYLHNQQNFRWALELGEALLIAIRHISSQDVERAADVIQGALNWYIANPVENWHFQRNFLKILIELRKAIGDSDAELHSLMLGQVKSFEDEGDWKRENYKSGGLVASTFYTTAFQIASDVGANEETKTRLKQKIQETLKASETEMKEVEVKTQIDMKPINDYIERLAAHPPSDIVRTIAHDPSFLPNLEAAQRAARQDSQKYIFSQFASRRWISQAKVVAQADELNTGLDATVLDRLLLDTSLKIHLLNHVFDALHKKGALTGEVIAEHLEKSGLFETNKLNVVKVGIERYFNNDYVSALHVLVPQLEDALRKLLAKTGTATISIQQGIMREIPLDTTLEQLKAWIGDDIYKYLWIALVDQRGFNLRHKVAHGLISVDDCRQEIVTMIIHQYLVLTRFKLQRRDSGGSNK